MDIIGAYSSHRFVPTGYFAFDASDELIHYDPDIIDSNQGRLALLHEISHAQLGHFNFQYDFELLIMETQAWRLTKQLCDRFNMSIDSSYIDDCIESYDKWLVSRSTCPDCGNFCLQQKNSYYRCFVCQCQWKTNPDRSQRVKISALS